MAWQNVKIRDERVAQLSALATADRRSLANMLDMVLERALGPAVETVPTALAGRRSAGGS